MPRVSRVEDDFCGSCQKVTEHTVVYSYPVRNEEHAREWEETGESSMPLWADQGGGKCNECGQADGGYIEEHRND